MSNVIAFQQTVDAAHDAYIRAVRAFQECRTLESGVRVLRTYEAFYDLFVDDKSDREVALRNMRDKLVLPSLGAGR
jgi:hypothetical protein